MGHNDMYVLDKFGYFVTVLRKNPSELFRLVRIGLNTFQYRYVTRCAGEGTVIGTGTQIINSTNVQIGRNCLLQDSIYIRAGALGKVIIGDRVAINSFCRLFGHGSIEIGEDTQLGPGTLITTTGHDYARDLEVSFQKVVIGRQVWVGANVTILPNVEIGDFTVIGAGAVVNKSIPANSLAVGVPARVIRRIERPHEGLNARPKAFLSL
jgi:acetyltransferase-like isoleucine patch superfamily enzyme